MTQDFWEPDGYPSRAVNDPYLRMLEAVILNAVRDARSTDQLKREAAQEFLKSEDCRRFLELTGFNSQSAERWLQAGMPGKNIQRSHTHSKPKENRMTEPIDISEQIRQAIEDNDLTDEQLTGFTNALNENLPQAITHAVAQAKAGRGDQATMMKNYKAELAKVAGNPTAVAAVKSKYISMGIRGIW
jgi:hypothetical protein